MTEPPVLPRVTWRDDFATGIAAVDHEHRELIGLLNQVFERLERDDDKEAVAAFLGEVHAGIAAHFALEEQFMQERKYDQYRDHKDDHERLLDEIREIMDAHDEERYAERKHAFAERLQAWFVEHFKTKDARLHGRLGG
ncbi:MAG: bacteriohemerythrin [Rhodospirillales bacterium]